LIAALREPDSLLSEVADKALDASMAGAVSGDEEGRRLASQELLRSGQLIASTNGRRLWERIARIVGDDMEEMRQQGLLERFEEADRKAGWEDEPEPDYVAGDAIRDYDGAPIEYEGPHSAVDGRDEEE